MLLKTRRLPNIIEFNSNDDLWTNYVRLRDYTKAINDGLVSITDEYDEFTGMIHDYFSSLHIRLLDDEKYTDPEKWTKLVREFSGVKRFWDDLIVDSDEADYHLFSVQFAFKVSNRPPEFTTIYLTHQFLSSGWFKAILRPDNDLGCNMTVSYRDTKKVFTAHEIIFYNERPNWDHGKEPFQDDVIVICKSIQDSELLLTTAYETMPAWNMFAPYDGAYPSVHYTQAYGEITDMGSNREPKEN